MGLSQVATYPESEDWMETKLVFTIDFLTCYITNYNMEKWGNYYDTISPTNYLLMEID